MNLTPATVVQTLSNIGKEIDDLTKSLVEAEYAQVVAKREHRKVYAVSFLANKVNEDGKPYTVNEREHLAYLATVETSETLDLAEYKVTALKDELRAKRDRMEIGRSLSAVMRVEWASA